MFTFVPWRRLQVDKDEGVIRRFLNSAAEASEEVFKDGMTGGHSGVHYARLPNRSSVNTAEAEYPANQFGPLMASIDTVVSANEFTIGSGVFYSTYLREGTSKMKRRRMSDNAMQEGVARTRHLLSGWIKWEIG